MAPPPPLPVITPAPQPLDSPSKVLQERQNVVTLSLTQSSTPTAAPKPAEFPFKIAIPALVGGMVLACLGAVLFMYMAKRKRRRRRERWELYQKRKARQRKNASAKTTPATSRRSSPTKRSPSEKPDFPPLPTLPRSARQKSSCPDRDLDEKQEYLIPKSESTSPTRDKYTTQPSLDSDKSSSTDSPSSSSSSKSSKLSSSSSSRSAARVAVAEKAAASAFGDPNTRYQPKKPSPLALAKEKKRITNDWGKGPFKRQPSLSQDHSPFHDSNALGRDDDDDREMLRDEGYDGMERTSGQWNDRGTSGEWNGGDSRRGSRNIRYSNDPYLNVYGDGDMRRSSSGVYHDDPYAAYHGRDSGYSEEDSFEHDKYEEVDDEEEIKGYLSKRNQQNRWV